MTVYLLQAVCLPAQHSRLVRASVEGPRGKVTTLFEAEYEALGNEGLVVEDGTVFPDEEGRVTLVVQNYGDKYINLETPCPSREGPTAQCIVDEFSEVFTLDETRVGFHSVGDTLD